MKFWRLQVHIAQEHEMVRFQTLVDMSIVIASQKPLRQWWPWKLALRVLRSNMFKSSRSVLFICQLLKIRRRQTLLNCLPSWIRVHFRQIGNCGRSHAERKAKGKVRWVPCLQDLGDKNGTLWPMTTFCREHAVNMCNICCYI